MKAIKQYFHVVLFIMLYKVVQTCKSEDETLVCDHSNESYWTVRPCGTIFSAWWILPTENLLTVLFFPQLTHGILMKELSHLKDEETLQCNDSVKIKTKEYIRSYMKKFGPVYKRS